MASDDKISNLPDEAIDKILMFLPIREAVKTCVLSTSWRYKWAYLPNLVFDTRSTYGKQTITNLVNFVDKTLLLHNGIISKFTLDYYLDSGCSDVDQWIRSLSRKMLKHLALVFMNSTNTYQIPSCLFSCQTLRTLELQGCKIILPSQYQGFSCLIYLKLQYETLTNQTLESLLVKIPLLDRLGILNCKSLTVLNINAPNLKSVFLEGDLIQSITFRNARKINAIGINLPKLLNGRKFEEAFGELSSSLHKLVIIQPFMGCCPWGIVPERQRLKTTYDRLTILVCIVSFEFPEQILAVLCLCRSSPHLKDLNIMTFWSKNQHSNKKDYREVQICKEDSIFHCLKTASLKGFKGVKCDIGFIEFILLNATRLENFYIKWDEKSDAVKKDFAVSESLIKCKGHLHGHSIIMLKALQLYIGKVANGKPVTFFYNQIWVKSK